MKIYKRGVSEDIIDGVSSIYCMANLKPVDTGLPFELWVDEVGSDRSTRHNQPRFKPKANGVQLDIVLSPDGVAKIVTTDTRKIRKFQYAKEAIAFAEQFKKPLLMHWNGDISSSCLSRIINLVVRRDYRIEDAIDTVQTGL